MNLVEILDGPSAKSLLRRSTFVLGLLFSLSLPTFASTLYIYPSIGPSAYSPNVDDYQENALLAIMSQSLLNPALPSTAGDPTLPSYYSQVTTGGIDPSDIITTTNGISGFNSWKGNLSPSGDFSDEFGNAIYFGLYVSSPDTDLTPDATFTMGDVGFDGDFIPGESLFGVSFSEHTIGYADCTGADYTTCSTVYDSPGVDDWTKPINFLFTSGFSAWFTETQINHYVDAVNLLYSATGSQKYTLAGGNDASIFITVVPEPGTLGLFGLGFSAALIFRRKLAALLGR